jgi:hypothetical protein
MRDGAKCLGGCGDGPNGGRDYSGVANDAGGMGVRGNRPNVGREDVRGGTGESWSARRSARSGVSKLSTSVILWRQEEEEEEEEDEEDEEEEEEEEEEEGEEEEGVGRKKGLKRRRFTLLSRCY